MKPPIPNQNYRLIQLTLLCLGLLSLAVSVAQAFTAGTHFSGRVLYRGTKTPVAGVTVEVVEAEDDGKPGDDDPLASARADAQGHFTVVLPQGTDHPVALVVSAVRTSAKTGGDRRHEGYEIKSHRTVLGFLTHPNPTKPNTVFIERRKPRHSADGDDD